MVISMVDNIIVQKKSGTDPRIGTLSETNERTGSCHDGIEKERRDVQIQQDN
jgi:hypothetical protein